MSEKYCPAGKINCEKYSVNGFDGWPGCRTNDGEWQAIPSEAELCSWPTRQAPVEPEHKNFLREQYLIFEKAGYGRGRADMKRDIGERVNGLDHWELVDDSLEWMLTMDNINAAIEGVK